MFCRLMLMSYFCSVDITKKQAKMKATAQELDYKKTTFEHLGFFVEYLVDGKLMGTKNVETNESGLIGYESTQHFVATEKIVFKRKQIKKGTSYYTRIYPLCGKVIKL